MVPVSPCLHQLFEAQARRTPGRPALQFEDARLSYAEADRRAGLLAQRLRRLGVGPDVVVGLFVERSLELMVAILGVLKAGGAYLPMETSYPPERVGFMLSDAGVKVLLTQTSLLPKLPASSVPRVTVDDFDWQGHAMADLSPVEPHHLAYVIYTSGSTGKPKGVGVEHRNIVNYVLGVIDRVRLEPGMSYATVSTIAADLGNTVVFPALVTGGCLHVIAQERAESQARLAEYFRREKIDVLKIVPSHLAALQSGRDPAEVMPRRRLILGGERSRLDWIERLRALAPECEIYNHYGPTETTVGVLTYRVDGALPATRTGTLPLGKPLPGSRVYVLNESGTPAPAGEQGELCIGGAGVARGYLNRPELTAEKFVADPFNGGKMYRTGDLARMLDDGAIEFCGRVDHQVKIHGYRVELGEIEGALREHPGVHDAVVLAREDESGDKQLVAYTAPAGTDAGALREHLKARLPQYMVPSAFVLLAKLPLTPNGKVDRQALAALSVESAQPAREVVAPQTETEKTLVRIWAPLLKVEHIGVDDDVFDLGAHSLMAMKALTQIRDAFGVSLALRNLFEHPTIGALAKAIDGLLWITNAKTQTRPSEREEIVL